MCTLSISNVIYHKFSHGAAFYTLNGKNVNVMLECCLNQCLVCIAPNRWASVFVKNCSNCSDILREKVPCAKLYEKFLY